jgi:hypothetical protein
VIQSIRRKALPAATEVTVSDFAPETRPGADENE